MLRKLIAVLFVLGIVAVGAIAYAYLKPTAEASEPISAIPLTAATNAPTSSEPAAVEPTSPPDAGSQATEASTTDPQVFEIDPTQSEARFTINEVLEGSPKTVIGTTDQVAGQIAVDVQNPRNTQVGTIRINARTLTTDNDMRNRAIRNRILLTDQYEYITFTPTKLIGLPESVTPGQPFQFQVEGELTIRETTQPVTFTAEVLPVSPSELNGSASATIRYADFGIAIPNVPMVTGVEETVLLEIDFVALAGQ